MDTTPNLSLTKPDIGNTNWGGPVNSNWDTLDKNAAIVRSVCDLRLTLESGVPVSTTDQLARTTLYLTPHIGKQIGLYYDSAWYVYETAEISLSLSGYTAGKNYDIWAEWNGSAVVLSSTVWTNDSTRATALTRQDGIYVKTGDATKRYIGTIRITSTAGQCEDSDVFRGVWNCYNQVLRRLYKYDGSGHSYTTASWRNWNNSSTSTLIEWVLGIAQNSPPFVSGLVLGGGGYLSLAVDGSTVATLRNNNSYMQASENSIGAIIQTAGYHSGIAREYGASGWYMYNVTVKVLLWG